MAVSRNVEQDMIRRLWIWYLSEIPNAVRDPYQLRSSGGVIRSGHITVCEVLPAGRSMQGYAAPGFFALGAQVISLRGMHQVTACRKLRSCRPKGSLAAARDLKQKHPRARLQLPIRAELSFAA